MWIYPQVLISWRQQYLWDAAAARLCRWVSSHLRPMAVSQNYRWVMLMAEWHDAVVGRLERMVPSNDKKSGCVKQDGNTTKTPRGREVLMSVVASTADGGFAEPSVEWCWYGWVTCWYWHRKMIVPSKMSWCRFVGGVRFVSSWIFFLSDQGQSRVLCHRLGYKSVYVGNI